jgi:hypothetical protein
LQRLSTEVSVKNAKKLPWRIGKLFGPGSSNGKPRHAAATCNLIVYRDTFGISAMNTSNEVLRLDGQILIFHGDRSFCRGKRSATAAPATFFRRKHLFKRMKGFPAALTTQTR